MASSSRCMCLVVVVVLACLAVRGESAKTNLRAIRQLSESQPGLSVHQEDLEHSTVEEIANQVSQTSTIASHDMHEIPAHTRKTVIQLKNSVDALIVPYHEYYRHS